LRGLVYTEVCPVRNNFLKNFFGCLREGLRGRGRGCLRFLLNFCLWLKWKREIRFASPVFVAVSLGQ